MTTVKMGVHQGSVLCPLLFTMVLEMLSISFRTSLPWELLYADDLVLIVKTEEHGGCCGEVQEMKGWDGV